MELRDYQQEALARLRDAAARGKRRIMLQAPTGFGKTRLAAAVVDGALRKGNRVIFTVPALSLIDQTAEMFWNEGIREIGVMQADHPMTDMQRPVQIASVQTLMRRRLPDAGVVMIDEAHRWFDFYGEWMARPEWQRIPFIGLSATPWTRGLGKRYDELIIAATTERLIKEGYLSPFKVFAPAHPDLKGVRTIAGDYHEGDLSNAMNKDKLTGDIIQTWLQRGEGRSTFCFAVDCAHAQAIHQKFQAAGVASEYIDAFTSREDREAVKRRFHESVTKVVCNVGVLTIGVDWDVRSIILARPTKSEMLFVQMIGRGLRTAEAKDHCLILDHSDTHLRLGFVTDIGHETLDDGKERAATKPRELLPKECPQCAALRPPRIRVCPNCGFEASIVSNVKSVNGELVEVNGHRVKDRVSIADKTIFLAELKAYGLQHGYKSGWAANKFRDKFKSWPHWSFKNVPPARYPSAATVLWIKSRAIAWAKSKNNPANRAAHA